MFGEASKCSGTELCDEMSVVEGEGLSMFYFETEMSIRSSTGVKSFMD